MEGYREKSMLSWTLALVPHRRWQALGAILYLLFHSLVTGKNFMVSSGKNLAVIYLKPRNCITKTIQEGKNTEKKNGRNTTHPITERFDKYRGLGKGQGFGEKQKGNYKMNKACRGEHCVEFKFPSRQEMNGAGFRRCRNCTLVLWD